MREMSVLCGWGSEEQLERYTWLWHQAGSGQRVRLGVTRAACNQAIRWVGSYLLSEQRGHVLSLRPSLLLKNDASLYCLDKQLVTAGLFLLRHKNKTFSKSEGRFHATERFHCSTYN